MKKIICLCLSVVLLLGVGPTAVTAAESGFNRSLYMDAISLLEGVGIFGKQDEFLSSSSYEVTRGEFARALVCLLGYRESGADLAPETSPYRDVSIKTAYCAEILLATQLGLFGDSVSAYFYPKERAESNWAAECVARVMGYGKMLERGSSAVIAKLGLLKDVKTGGKYLRRDGAVQMFCNALEEPIMQVVGVNGSKLVLKSYKDETILSEYFGIVYVEDVLTANSYAALHGEKTAEGYVRIGDVRYHKGVYDTNSIIGKKIRAYYKEDDTDKTLIYIKKLQNSEIALSADKAEYDYNANCYTAEVEGKTQRYKLKLSTMVAYNGKPCYETAARQPKTGQIVLIDNDNDGSYEVCMIREFTNVITESVNAAIGVIYDKWDAERNIQTKQYETFTLYSEKGSSIDISELAADKIVTLYESYDKKEATAYVSSKSSSLQLQGMDLTERTVTMDGETYTLSADYRLNLSDLSVGQYYFFYLNHWNEVAFVAESGSYSAYWLMEIKKGSGLDPTVSVRGLSEDGEIVNYDLAEKVTWYTYAEGRVVIKRDEAYHRLQNSGKANRQLLKISLNPSGYLNEIVVAYSAETRAELLSMAADFPLIRMNYIRNEWPEALKADTNQAEWRGQSFGYWLTFSSDAISMRVPLNGTASYDDDRVMVQSVRGKSNEKRVIADIDVYTSGKNKITADYIVREVENRVDVQLESEGYFFKPYLVEKVVTCIDDATGDEAVKLCVMNASGGRREYLLTDPKVIERAALMNMGSTLRAAKERVEAGDIVAFEVNPKGKIERLKLAYDGVNMADAYPDSSLSASTTTCVEGTILRRSNTVIECAAKAEFIHDENTILCIDAASMVVEFNKTKQTVQKSKPENLYPGDKVVAFFRWSDLNMVVVYRNE